MDSLRGTREAGKDHLDSLVGTREAPGAFKGNPVLRKVERRPREMVRT